MSRDDLHPDDRRRIDRRRRTRAQRLAEAEATFRRWLHLPDVRTLHVALGIIAANLLPGDPAWLLVVGAPSSGKTEVVNAFTGLDFVHPAATITEPALLSGSPKREHAEDATGGLLRQIGEFGVILCTDFGSVISMNHENRSQVLAALREVYDGSWTRLLGTDGGRTLHWHGKCGFLGACTPSIDRAHAVMGTLGERFTLYRLTVDAPGEQARRRLANRGHEREMRDALEGAIADVLEGIHDGLTDLTGNEERWLIRCACFAVIARTAVERDGYGNHDVELLPEHEGPGRLVGILGQLSAGLSAIGVDDVQRWRLLGKIAADSVPTLRRTVLDLLDQNPGWLTQTDVAAGTRVPYSTTARTLEDLVLLGLVERSRVDTTRPRFALSDFARATWPEASPESPGAPL